MIRNIDNDTLHDDDMLALCQAHASESSAFGEEYSQHLWRQDLIEADQQLKTLAASETLLHSDRLIMPDGYGSNVVMLAPDALLDTLTTLYTVLVMLFHNTDIGRHYQPSPYAQRFLWAFQSCDYLHEAGFHQPPTMTRQKAGQVIVDINSRLTYWHQCLRQPDFTYECNKNRRNSRNNHQRLSELVNRLFDCHSRLTVLRVDLSYSEEDSPYIDYETSCYHRDQLCRRFHKNDLFHHLLGYAWKLEWKPKKGFHYHFIFFFNGHQVQEDITLAKRIGELWVTYITRGQGHYFNCNFKADSIYRYNAMGRIEYHDFEKRRGLDYIIRYLTKIDEYAAMLVTGRTFQTSTMPSAITGPRPGRPRQLPMTWDHDVLHF